MKTNLLMIIVLTLTISYQLTAVSNDTTIKKDLTALKTDQPPTIDGVLDDTCWQDAPQATGFTDERTEKPAKNQSVGRLVYTDTAIYVGLHLYDDMPDKIVARQTKDQTRIRGEDSVSFSLDPFSHTSVFRQEFLYGVNPLGTKYRASRHRTCRKKRMDRAMESRSTDCGRRMGCGDGDPMADARLSRHD